MPCSSPSLHSSNIQDSRDNTAINLEVDNEDNTGNDEEQESINKSEAESIVPGEEEESSEDSLPDQYKYLRELNYN